MKKKSSILERARTVLKTTGTLGQASAGQFVDRFCDEVERKACEQADKTAEMASDYQEPEKDNEEEKER